MTSHPFSPCLKDKKRSRKPSVQFTVTVCVCHAASQSTPYCTEPGTPSKVSTARPNNPQPSPLRCSEHQSIPCPSSQRHNTDRPSTVCSQSPVMRYPSSSSSPPNTSSITR